MNILKSIFCSGKMPRNIPKPICPDKPQPPAPPEIRPRIKAILDVFRKSPSLTINGILLREFRGGVELLKGEDIWKMLWLNEAENGYVKSIFEEKKLRSIEKELGLTKE